MPSQFDIVNSQHDSIRKAQKVVPVNDSGTPVNPATEEGIQNVLAELQNNLDDLNLVLRRLLKGIVNPPYIDKTANQIRAQVTGSATVTLTSTTLTGIGGYDGTFLNRNTSINTWANNVRARL